MIEGTDAVILIVVFCGMSFGLFAATLLWQRIFALAVLAGATGYTLYSFKFTGLGKFYRERCRQYAEVIQQDPTNRAARQFLADTLYQMGELDRAIDEMQMAVGMGADIESQYKLSKWTKERYVRDCPNPICRWCQTENVQGARQCVKCGAQLPYRSPFNQWLAGGRTAKTRYYLIVAVGSGVLVVSVVLLPLKLALIPLACLLLAMAGWSLISSARS